MKALNHLAGTTHPAAEQLFKRFTSGRGEALVIDSLKDQHTILGNEAAAEQLAARGQLRCFEKGEVLMEQGDGTNSIFLLLAGKVDILINGVSVSSRSAHQHVGEMAMIDPSEARAATARAMEPTVALEVDEVDFTATASHFPDIWRQLAKELATRLRQRSTSIRQRNAKPRTFVASASESIAIAEAFKAQLSSVSDVKVWTADTFKPSRHTMDSLANTLDQMDFVVAIFSPDDSVTTRKKRHKAPRDNTVFELGLFAGRMGIERSFYAIPTKARVKIPSDLAGITAVKYVGEANIDVTQACEQIRESIEELGSR